MLGCPQRRSPLPASLHCGGGKSGSSGGDFSRGSTYDSGSWKCFLMMFSRLILGIIRQAR